MGATGFEGSLVCIYLTLLLTILYVTIVTTDLYGRKCSMASQFGTSLNQVIGFTEVGSHLS